MSNVMPIAPQHKTLEAPESLRRLPGWLIWRFEQFPNEPKPRKVPYYAEGGKRHGANGTPTDRAKLTSFADARDAAARRGFDGVGLAMLADWGVTALDFDRCVDSSGRLPPEIEAVVADTYAEYSPSGEGVRAFVQGALGNAKTDSKADKAQGRYGVETFSSTGFVTFTGRPLAITELLGNENTIAPANTAVQEIIQRRLGSGRLERRDQEDPFFGFEPRMDLTAPQMEHLLQGLDASMGRDEWIRVGMALHHETSGDDTGFSLWDEWSANAHNYPGTEALQAQWESFDRREGSVGRPVTMASVVKMYSEAKAKSEAGVGPDEAFTAIADKVRAEILEGTAHEGVRTPSDYAGRYKVESAASFSKRPSPPWLIKGVLPQADLIVLFGASGAGKSFVALDMGAAIARGVTWRGKRVRKGRVVIIAAEGGGGFAKRLQAYCQHHMVSPGDLDIGIVNATPSLMEREDMSELVAAIVAAGGADLCIMDTFAQMTAGADENSAGEMGRALSHAKALKVATGATVMLVHHTGKDSTKGARGSTVIRGAADAEIEVAKLDTGRVVRTTKQKDADDGGEWGFALEQIQVGIDEDNDPITSCVIIEAEVPVAPAHESRGREPKPEYGKHEGHIMELLNEQRDKGLAEVPTDAFIDTASLSMPGMASVAPSARRQLYLRALTSLQRKKTAAFTLLDGNIVFFPE